MEHSTTFTDVAAVVFFVGLAIYIFGWLLFVKPIIYAARMEGTERVAWLLLIVLASPIGAAVFWGVKPYKKLPPSNGPA